MEDFGSILIVILSLATAVFTAIAQKKKADVKFKRIDDAPDAAASAKEKAAAEGQRMIRHKDDSRVVEEGKKGQETAPARRIDIDKKKLIIYSEIMKPKFDQ